MGFLTRPRVAWLVGLPLLLLAGAANVFKFLRNDYFLDLSIYRWGGMRAFDAGSLYDRIEPLSSLQFTYTPFAAALFAPLSRAHLLEALPWTVASMLALARASWLLGRAALDERATADTAPRTRGQLLRVGALIFGVMLVLEPAAETLRLGQVNFFLLWLIVEDVLGRERRWSGVLVGLAAAIKLTPASFLVLFAVTDRVRAAVLGVLAFVAAAAVGFALLPIDSRDFWSGAGFDADRTGAMEYIANQSINGMVWRLGGPGGSDAWWIGLSLVVAAVGILTARRAWRAGQRNLALGVTGVVSCLVSPVSWTHHWVLVLPLLVALWDAPRWRTGMRLIVLAAIAVLGSRLLWHMPFNDGAEFHQSGFEAVKGNAYVLVGFVLVAAGWFAVRRSESTTRR